MTAAAAAQPYDLMNFRYPQYGSAIASGNDHDAIGIFPAE
jgi:hypothetical protein